MTTDSHDSGAPSSPLAELDPAVLDAYLSGRCTPLERVRAEQWMLAVPGRRALLEGMRHGVRSSAIFPPRRRIVTAERVLRVHHSVRSERWILRRFPALGRHAPWEGIFSRQTLLRAFICMALCISATVGVGIGVARRTTLRAERSRVATYTARVGQCVVVTTARGARVTLAPSTTIRVQGNTVDLLGEAYFEVPNVSSAPFVVHTGRIVTQVLGTAFDVRRYAEDHTTRVVVAQGKVMVGARQQITASRGMIVHATDSTITTERQDITTYSAWTTGHLMFRNAPLPEVLAMVGRWYGVRFQLADSALTEQHVTAALDFGSREELLRALRLILDVRMTFGRGTDSTVTLHLSSNHPTPLPHTRRDGLDTFTHTLEIGR